MSATNPEDMSPAITTLRTDRSLDISGADMPGITYFYITTGGLVETPVDSIRLAVIPQSYNQGRGELVVTAEGQAASLRERFAIEGGSLRSARGAETRIESVNMPVEEFQAVIAAAGERGINQYDLDAIWLKENLEAYFAANAGVWEEVQRILSS